jgi:hypothetical protein
MGLKPAVLSGLMLLSASALLFPSSAQPSINNQGLSAPGDWTVYPGSYNSQRHVVKKNGQTMEGVMRNQDAWSVQFTGMDDKLYSFERTQLRSVTIKRGGIMPSDYDKRLSADEFKDLLAFLTRQGVKPAPSSGGGGE